MKMLKFIGSFVFLFILVNTAYAERITSFDANIQINNDGTIQVTEKITYDFQGKYRHGIYRDIPLSNRDGSNITLSNIEVTNNDNSEQVSVSVVDGNKQRIQIGKPNIEITGNHLYQINYTVNNALMSFPEYDELYWNINGNDWSVSSEYISSTVTGDDITEAVCFIGKLGSKKTCNIETGLLSNNNYKVVAQESNVNRNEGMTIGIKIKKGTILNITRIGDDAYKEYLPTWKERLLNTIQNRVFQGGFGVLLLGILGWVVYRRRSPNATIPIIPWYETPEGLEPIMIGTIIDKALNPQDIIGQLIYLAEQGYLKIERHENKGKLFNSTDYYITLVKDTSSLSEINQKVLNFFIPIGTPINQKVLIEPQNSTIGTAYLLSLLWELREKLAIYVEEKEFAKIEYRAHTGITKFFVGVGYLFYTGVIVLVLTSLFNQNFEPTTTFYIVSVSLFLVLLFGIFSKIRHTQTGIDTKQKILGFKKFIELTDKERVNFHNAPDKNPEQFMKILPYAIALGIEQQWVKQFPEISNMSVDWYSDNTHDITSLYILNESLQGLTGTLSDTFISSTTTQSSSGSSSSFGGGGFSGGGSGGGGGGSW